jgi:hypothetical protein
MSNAEVAGIKNISRWYGRVGHGVSLTRLVTFPNRGRGVKTEKLIAIIAEFSLELIRALTKPIMAKCLRPAKSDLPSSVRFKLF